MKKKIVLLICLLFLCGCGLIHKVEYIPSSDLNTTKSGKDSDLDYIDKNPIKLSLYASDEEVGLKKLDNNIDRKWVKKKDIIVVNALFTEAETVSGEYFQDMWKQYADKYDTSYKVGWNVSFGLSNGQKINKMIFSPKDVEEFYDYLEIYLYDSANVEKDVFYSHLLEKNMNDNTIMTSMKLTAGSKYEEINTPISVVVYSYDTQDDFAENGLYRGNSKYVVNIYNQ